MNQHVWFLNLTNALGPSRVAVMEGINPQAVLLHFTTVEREVRTLGESTKYFIMQHR